MNEAADAVAQAVANAQTAVVNVQKGYLAYIAQKQGWEDKVKELLADDIPDRTLEVGNGHVEFHVPSGPLADTYVGKDRVIEFLTEFNKLCGGDTATKIRLLSAASDGDRVVATDRTKTRCGEQEVDHVCADSYTFGEGGLITRAEICHMDEFASGAPHP